MKIAIHQEIVRTALTDVFAEDALNEVIKGNIGQDAVKYQIGHDHYHFDNNSFVRANEYCQELRSEVIRLAELGNSFGAREAFGKLSHTTQDLYAHSNYIELYRAKYPNGQADQIDPLDQDILNSKSLVSGKLYYPFEVITFFKGIPDSVKNLFPKDSHARMNIDDPSRPNYNYAFEAAVKRTRIEYDGIKNKLTPAAVIALTGKR